MKKKVRNLSLCVCLLVIIITCVISTQTNLLAIFNKEHYRNSSQLLYIAGPTKCFSCEQDLINRYQNTDFAFMGKPTKCFDCENQMVAQNKPNLANLTQPTKCFDCERELMN